MGLTRTTVVILALCAGCMVQNSKEKLSTSLHQYNAAVRWGAVEWASEHVAPDKREELLTRRKEFGDISITQCKVGAVSMKGKHRATAMVRVDWYTVRSLRLMTSFIRQDWEMMEGKWQITAQRLVRGAPCPLFIPKPTRQFERKQMWPKISVAPGS